MSNKTNLVSLIQLISYTGFKDFLTQYHEEVKKETGQFIGVSKALACATNVIKGYKNHHQFTHSLEKVETNRNLFGIRKNVIIVTTIENTGDDNLDFTTDTYNSWESAKRDIAAEFQSLAMREDINGEYLLELFYSNYDCEDLESFDSDLDFINHIESNDSIDIYDFVSAIEDITNKERQISIKDAFLDLNVTTGDVHEAIHKNDFETGLDSE